MNTTTSASADIQFYDHGSIVLLYASSDAGRAWVDENIGDEDVLMWGDGIAVEPRYCTAIFEGATNDGLDVVFHGAVLS